MGLIKGIYILVGLLVIVSISANPQHDWCDDEIFWEPQRDLIVGTKQPGDIEAKTIRERYPANESIPDWTQILARDNHVFTYIEAWNVGAPGNGQKISTRYGGPNCSAVWFDFHSNNTEDYFYDIKLWLRPISGNQTDEEPILTKHSN